MSDDIRYSDLFDGDERNHKLALRFDQYRDGCVGISHNDRGAWKDRVLLTPEQVRALNEFFRDRPEQLREG
jgi:hypothetical protein